MCGIVGAVAERPVNKILVEGLKRLEYRGYDSAGVALLDGNTLKTVKAVGKVVNLESALEQSGVSGHTGIAHTRWATHGSVTEANAHPHVSSGQLALVHNGIIENHVSLRAALKGDGYEFLSDTDTEVMVHLIHQLRQQHKTLLASVQAAVKQFEGAFGTVVFDKDNSNEIIVARSGSPLVIGLGLGENFIASDQLALLPVTRSFIFLEEGDVARITRDTVEIFDADGNAVEREVVESNITQDASGKGDYRHYMLKEIYEQPLAVRNTLEGRLNNDRVAIDAFGDSAQQIFKDVKHVQIIACGTSYHSGMVARYWLEQFAGVSCNVEIASEFRYRQSFVHEKSLLVTISQSGETADTLAALRLAKQQGYMASMTICNVPGSSLVRESDLAFMTKAGAEIGVASTKAFTTQLVGLLMLTASIAQEKGLDQSAIVNAIKVLPAKLEETLQLADSIAELAEEFADKQHSLFLGRGSQYPIAMEGALKLKEISYIHAEAYAAGELKHGPLALIDADMPIIVVAPNNELLEKLKSNVEEVRARGGIIYVFADKDSHFESDNTMRVINVNHTDDIIAPIVYTLPLQLLSYYVAVIKGTDVDQPRNLAKSVTVE
ncbi:glutamine--fructose-6-phosphate transaminase (isomerizing) [Pseudoalteromonas sp. HL-AS2]|jgi:glucosamine--fructose-6-phosphate aminotransferase (isomerizing)|uniref:Glutamine--fructose-6-phosphate aminotransferase [isomerizing] n=1 Tax=Pseudoalteromonas translucida (strain TAC 125) TaxID=326442 RepID=Q3IK37_PSET1|nr:MULTISPECIES: glutamine--fructose-6-phosphate transaminase (isomerizing) [Pseudoalteromonas]MBB1371842.1 glutamine--fructose-6-phosphate transaminase (isomerizing) [Pseudoalteromonas sp. SR45-4]MBB1406246.1 glutamine--fructose-6-phosphate transaminase (isomerizing) [Pseudoalteromonas sp. SG44-5]MBE0421604.1 glutamine--fructose-6-phosphate transaminase (isomerizing) [Pseudoalteromonas nigrifaciens]MBH0093552.1 glutamine--fructose-6-phosphate transaminase (isomerizing) [Pseudoalteromonas sp. S|tara:strand:+ start:2325 stop:4145 length:1821 start_codon:yes stop_codon:yes gene_type:complete